MAYISKRDGSTDTNGSESKKQAKNTKKTPLIDQQEDEYDDDLDGEDEQDEDNDKAFKQNLDTEFPLSGGETDDDA